MRGGEVKNFYYLVMGYREGGRVKQKTLFRLGEYPTFDAYLKAKEEEQRRIKGEVARLDQGSHPLFVRTFWLNKLPKLKKEYRRALEVKQKYVVE